MVSATRTQELAAAVPCPRGCCADARLRGHHDRLLAAETDVDALVDLFELAVTWGELDYSRAGVIPPEQWIDFAERHHWQDSERARRIFGLATDIVLRSEARNVWAPPASVGQ